MVFAVIVSVALRRNPNCHPTRASGISMGDSIGVLQTGDVLDQQIVIDDLVVELLVEPRSLESNGHPPSWQTIAILAISSVITSGLSSAIRTTGVGGSVVSTSTT